MQNKLYLDPLCVIFVPDLDHELGYETLIFDRIRDEIIKIDKYGYKILKTINDNPGINIDQMVFKMGQSINRKNLERFISTMTNYDIIIKNE